MDWSISEVARLTGTTSRTLRHYGDVGLVQPSRIGENGYRFYDQHALSRLQRVLVLRQLGLGIPAITDVINQQRDDVTALETHLAWLRQERDRIERQIASVEKTIRKTKGGEQLMAQEMFDGFDNNQYKAEVEERWGQRAYADSAGWWSSKSQDQRVAFKKAAAELGDGWTAAAESGAPASGEIAQALAARHVDWLSGIPGTPQTDAQRPTAEYVLGLADMYVADPRFAANYGGVEGATLVREALAIYASHNL